MYSSHFNYWLYCVRCLVNDNKDEAKQASNLVVNIGLHVPHKNILHGWPSEQDEKTKISFIN